MYLTKVVQNSKIKIWKKFSWKFRIRIFIRAGFNIFRIFWIFCIRSMYESFLSNNFWIISNGWFMVGYVLHNLPSVQCEFRLEKKIKGILVKFLNFFGINHILYIFQVMSVLVNLTHAMVEELVKNTIILSFVFVPLIVWGDQCERWLSENDLLCTYVFQCSMAIHLMNFCRWKMLNINFLLI